MRGPPRAGAPLIGVVAVQGDFDAHASLLGDLGARTVLVRRPADLDGVEALVFPGGESTAMSMLLDSAGLIEPITARLRDGLPALGTCAGMILLAARIEDGRSDQHCFGAIQITVQRNAFGRQLDSFEADLRVRGIEGGDVHAVFIRAPLVLEVGPRVEVLAEVAAPRSPARPVICREGCVTVTAFHPELTGEQRLHRLLLADLEQS